MGLSTEMLEWLRCWSIPACWRVQIQDSLRLPVTSGSVACKVVRLCALACQHLLCYPTGDADLLPAALAILANVHARGIIHGDLREENFLVNEAGIAMGGAKTIMLFDFSHSSIDSDKEAQAYEVDEMVDLFESL